MKKETSVTAGLPQPGSSNNSQRRYIKHCYHDHSLKKETALKNKNCTTAFNSQQVGNSESGSSPCTTKEKICHRNAEQFPLKLHRLLDIVEKNGSDHIISWQIHGRAFKIHKADKFAEEIMPLYFRQSKIASFRRQLNIYGFLRITQGPDKGAYYHELFLRGRFFLADRIIRQRLKGTMVKGMPCPEAEPNFYSMPYVLAESEWSPKIAPSTPKNDFTQSFSQLPMCSSPSNLLISPVTEMGSIHCKILNPTMLSFNEESSSKMLTFPQLQANYDNLFYDEKELDNTSIGGYSCDDFALDCKFVEEVIAVLVKELEEPLKFP